MKRPSFQFYPNDWMSDAALRMCSLAARGLWADMMSIMHDCSPYGYLVVNGKGILPAVLARRVGASLDEVQHLLDELGEHAVYGVSEQGWIFSRRMVRDEHNRQVRAAGGVKSLENENVPRPKVGGKVSLQPSPTSTPTSSSTSKPFLEDFEAVWSQYPKRAGANNKRDAYFAYRARRKTGVTAQEIADGVERYARYIRAAGKEGTEYVKMASSFFGPSQPYAEAWTIPTAPSSTNGKTSTNGKGSTTRAMSLIKLVRDRRNPLFPNNVVPEWQNGLSDSDVRICKTFGITRMLNDQNEGTVVAQLARALEESA